MTVWLAYRHIPLFIIIWLRYLIERWEKSNCHLQLSPGIYTGPTIFFPFLYKYPQALAASEVFQNSDVSLLILKERTDRCGILFNLRLLGLFHPKNWRLRTNGGKDLVQGFHKQAVKDVSFNPVLYLQIIPYAKKRLTFLATKLTLNALITPVTRFWDILKQFISQWGSYLNKISLHIFLHLGRIL